MKKIRSASRKSAKTAGAQSLKKAPMPTLDTAPRDGTPFLSCDPRFGAWSLTVRRVKFVADLGGGKIDTIDLGAWLHIDGIDNDWAERDTAGEPSWSIAPDAHNNPKDRVWVPLRLAGASPLFEQGARAFVEYEKAMATRNDVAAMAHYEAASNFLRAALAKAKGEHASGAVGPSSGRVATSNLPAKES